MGFSFFVLDGVRSFVAVKEGSVVLDFFGGYCDGRFELVW